MMLSFYASVPLVSGQLTLDSAGDLDNVSLGAAVASFLGAPRLCPRRFGASKSRAFHIAEQQDRL